MAEFESLKHHFLIAMPSLKDGIFANSVTYLCEHNEQGAMGLVINQPLDLSLDEVFEQLDLEIIIPHREPILAGGPVQTERGFVLHRAMERDWDATLRIHDGISLTTSRDILAAMAEGQGPDDVLVALGYAGWSAGQLEQELVANAWLTLPADDAILFDIPFEQRLHAAASKLGIDLSLISPQAGHA